jgi:hypothetical protein
MFVDDLVGRPWYGFPVVLVSERLCGMIIITEISRDDINHLETGLISRHANSKRLRNKDVKHKGARALLHGVCNSEK